MAEQATPGSIGWHDLTVADAAALRPFYEAVCGWTSQPHAMGGYDDYVMLDASGAGTAGVCHARGLNDKVPPQWLMYVIVENLQAKIDEAIARGGQLLDGPRDAGGGSMAVLRDPAGAAFALYEAAR